MPRFFKEDIDKSLEILGEDAKHIALSLRIRKGEIITVCNGNGNDFECEITSVSKEKVTVKILSSCKTLSEPSVDVTLFQCLQKSDKFETVIQKSVELGVNNIVPVLSERCISRPDKKSQDKKTERWNKISESAAKQSGRGILPKVFDVITFKEMEKMLKNFDLSLFLYEKGGEPIKNAFLNKTPKSVAVIIGPEGGFSESEAESMNNCGAFTVTLGKRILRTETAPIVSLSAVMLLTNNLE